MRDRDDSIVSSPHDFCASLSSVYSDLFSTSLVDPHIQADLLKNLSSSLSDDQSSLCEGHLSVDEVLSSLRGMARPKAHMLTWVAKELSSLAFSFFWSGKRELVSRSVMIQSALFGGFLLSVFCTRCGLFLASG